jgi:hypothetical protein
LIGVSRNEGIPEAAVAMLEVLIEFRMVKNDSDLAKYFDNFISKYTEVRNGDAGRPTLTQAADIAAGVIIEQINQRSPDSNGAVSEIDYSASAKILINKLASEFDSRMKRLFDAVKGGRFLLTVALSGAFESTSALNDQRGELPTAEVDKAMRRVTQFLSRLELSLQGVPSTIPSFSKSSINSMVYVDYRFLVSHCFDWSFSKRGDS